MFAHFKIIVVVVLPKFQISKEVSKYISLFLCFSSWYCSPLNLWDIILYIQCISWKTTHTYIVLTLRADLQLSKELISYCIVENKSGGHILTKTLNHRTENHVILYIWQTTFAFNFTFLLVANWNVRKEWKLCSILQGAVWHFEEWAHLCSCQDDKINNNAMFLSEGIKCPNYYGTAKCFAGFWKLRDRNVWCIKMGHENIFFLL